MHTSLLIASLLVLVSLAVSRGNPASSSPAILVVVNQVEHSVLLVDPASRTIVSRIVVGVNGHEVAVSKDGRYAYVPIYGNSGVGNPGTDGTSIDVLDIHERKLAYSIDLGKPLRPHRAEFGPDSFLYVSAELANALAVVDTSSHQLIGEVSTGQPQSHMFVLSPDGRRAYTANVGAGSVSVLDLASRSLVAVIPVAKRIQRISISLDGHRLFTHDQEQPRLAVIDAATDKISHWVQLPAPAYASAPTPDGRFLLVVSSRADQLYVFDSNSLNIVKTFALPAGPMEILIPPAGNLTYISCIRGGRVAVLDLRSWQLLEPMVLTPGVDGLAWAPASS